MYYSKRGRQRGKNNENLNEIDMEARRGEKDDRKTDGKKIGQTGRNCERLTKYRA